MLASNVYPSIDSENDMRRAIVIGGSLGGLFAGATLMRSGWDVTIVERSGRRLEGRGAGLGVHSADAAGVAGGRRGDRRQRRRRCRRPHGLRPRWEHCRQASHAEVLHLVGSARLDAIGRLSGGTRPNTAPALAGFVEDDNGVTARFADGSQVRADMLIGADGVRSTVRRQMFPDVDLIYAGYIAWRGMVEEAALTPSAHAAVFHRFGWGLLDREHVLGYPVPGAFDDLTLGHRRFNFVWYRPVDAATTLAEMQTDATGRVHPEGIPPS